MMAFSTGIRRSSRSTVWMMVGATIALATLLFAKSWRGSRFGLDADKSGLKLPANQCGEVDTDAALFAALERLEQQAAAAIGRARESVVALEYTAADAPPGTRRVATGVVINNRGEVLSVRIDPPLAGRSSGTADDGAARSWRDFAGRRCAVRLVSGRLGNRSDFCYGFRLEPYSRSEWRLAGRTWEARCSSWAIHSEWGTRSPGDTSPRLDACALELGTRQLGGLIQIQVSLYPGDSGAAVVDLHGDWLGLIRSGLAPVEFGIRGGTKAQMQRCLGYRRPRDPRRWL